MEGKDIIKYGPVGEALGYSKEHLRKGRKVANEENQKAIDELEDYCSKWAEKYTNHLRS